MAVSKKASKSANGASTKSGKDVASKSTKRESKEEDVDMIDASPVEKKPAAENKWRKVGAAVKGGKSSKQALVEPEESDDSEDEEVIIPTKGKKPSSIAAKKKQPVKSDSDDEEDVKPHGKKSTKGSKQSKVSESESEDEEISKPTGKSQKAVASTKSGSKAKAPVPSSSEEEDEGEDEEEEEEDEDEDEDDEDDVKRNWMDSSDEEEEADDDEFGGISTKKGKKAQTSLKKKLADSEDEEDEPEERVRLTHMGEEVEDDEAEFDDQEEEEAEDQGENDEGEGEENDEDEVPLTPGELASRIKETAAALADFKAYRKRTKSQISRSQMVTRLSKDCAAYYGYIPDLIDLFLTLFGPTEMVEFLEANEVPRPTCIRANTLKTTRRELAKALTARGIGLEPVADWTNVGLKIFESQIPVGATPEYLAGHYMIQSPSSLAPVMALDPRPGEKVLDMCAAPGGKTSHIAQLMRNEGFLVANDAKLPRIDALVANLARMGVKIAASVHQDGKDFPKVLGGFDRILLDAPCSGLGVISHDPSVKQSRTLQDIQSTSNLQRELLLAAIDSCDHKSKTGGVIVYSTCSISVQENEHVVQYALEKRDVVLVECGFEFGKPGLTRWQGKLFHPNMKLCKRLYPHTHNMDGFFIAKLKKRSNAILENGKPIAKKKSAAEGEEASNGTKKKNSDEEGDEMSSVDSDEEKRRKKQSNWAKRKTEKMKKKFGGVVPGQQQRGGAGAGGKKRPSQDTKGSPDPKKQKQQGGGSGKKHRKQKPKGK